MEPLADPNAPSPTLRLTVRAAAAPLVRSLTQFGHTVRGYGLTQARHDAQAGLTVSVVAVPQAMAYAIIAGVPPVYGVYTVIFQSLLGAIFASQPMLSVGPINTQSLLTVSVVTRIVSDGPGGPDPVGTFLGLVLALTMVKGFLQIVMAELRLGNLVKFVSRSVVVGFTAGAGVLIAAGQINGFLGFSVERSGDDWPGLIGVVERLWGHWQDISPVAIGLGVLALGLMFVARAISKLMPGPLIAVAVTGVVVMASGWTQDHLTLIGELPKGLPVPHFPMDAIFHFEDLLGGALALSLLGLMEAYSIGKSLAAKGGGNINANQELFGQGVINFVSAFFSCIPGSGSFSRSALNHYAGARTQVSSFFNAGFVLIILLAFGGFARHIPMSAIAAVLFVIAYSLIDWRYLRRVFRSNKADAAVCVGTFLATLFTPLAYAVFIGIALNLALYIRRASQLHMSEMVRTSAGPFQERELRTRATEKEVVFLQLEGDLFFAVADELRDRLMDLNATGVRVVILRLKRTHSIDATVLQAIEEFVQTMNDRGGHVILCGVKPELMEKLTAFGLVKIIGEKNVFATGFGVFASAKRALRRAQELIGASVDLEGLDREDETEGWAYQI